MTTAQILITALAALALVAAAAIFAIAWRRGGERPDEAPAPRDRRRRGERVPAEAGLHDEGPPPLDPLEAREEISNDDYQVTRRQFFNRGILAAFGVFLAQFGVAALAFMWPKLRAGGFGSKVNAGKLADIAAEVDPGDGRITPYFIAAAQAYVVPFNADAAGSSFDGLPVVAGGYMALWQKCVHLGCRVPTCDSSQGFECPCHGSKYNYHGEYEDGPAPRNLDRFVVTVNDADELVIDTGQVIQTARAAQKTVQYPQGPSCI